MNMNERYRIGYCDPTPHVCDAVRKPVEPSMLPALAGLFVLLFWATAILLLRL